MRYCRFNVLFEKRHFVNQIPRVVGTLRVKRIGSEEDL